MVTFYPGVYNLYRRNVLPALVCVCVFFLCNSFTKKPWKSYFTAVTVCSVALF